MFDDLPHNLETAHRLGMTTVLVDGMTDHPEHQAIAGWTELPAHIHHRTDALAPFLAAVGAALAQEKDRSSAAPLQAQFCLT
jgi:putative hydrolase of the HAD superfamily